MQREGPLGRCGAARLFLADPAVVLSKEGLLASGHRHGLSTGAASDALGQVALEVSFGLPRRSTWSMLPGVHELRCLSVDTRPTSDYPAPPHAEVAELADAQDSGSCGVKPVEVRVLSSAQRHLGHSQTPRFARGASVRSRRPSPIANGPFGFSCGFKERSTCRQTCRGLHRCWTRHRGHPRLRGRCRSRLRCCQGPRPRLHPS